MKKLAFAALAFGAFGLFTACGGGSSSPDAGINTGGDGGGGSDGGGPSACNPVAQTGCAAGEKCTQRVDSLDPFLAVTACVADGAVPLGSACVAGDPAVTGADDCAAGGYCVNSVCTEICSEAPDSCPSATVCVPFSQTFDEGVGLCQPTCDVLMQNCPNGEGCYIGLTSGKSSCAPAFGETMGADPGKQGVECNFLNTCAVGFGCTLINDAANPTGNVCAKFCDTLNAGGPTCAGGADPYPSLTCVQINGFYGDVEAVPTTVGFCVDCLIFAELDVCVTPPGGMPM